MVTLKTNANFILFLLDTKWQELNKLTVDRQQKLEESSNNLTQFQTTEAQLKQWLLEKELMVSVLGPLSIDPNMLHTQRQQVQVSITCGPAATQPLDLARRMFLVEHMLRGQHPFLLWDTLSKAGVSENGSYEAATVFSLSQHAQAH